MLGSTGSLTGQDIVDDADVISRIDMQVRLNDGRVSGAASQFYDTETREAFSGRLPITGSLDRTAITTYDAGLTGRINGTLQSASLGQITIRTDLLGDVYGPNAGFVFGYVDGSATSSVGTDPVQGVIIAERQ